MRLIHFKVATLFAYLFLILFFASVVYPQVIVRASSVLANTKDTSGYVTVVGGNYANTFSSSGTLAAPTGLDGNGIGIYYDPENEEPPENAFTGTRTFHVHLYAYKDWNGYRIFSTQVVASKTYTGEAGEFYNFEWSWNAVAGATGYLLIPENSSEYLSYTANTSKLFGCYSEDCGWNLIEDTFTEGTLVALKVANAYASSGKGSLYAKNRSRLDTVFIGRENVEISKVRDTLYIGTKNAADNVQAFSFFTEGGFGVMNLGNFGQPFYFKNGGNTLITFDTLCRHGGSGQTISTGYYMKYPINLAMSPFQMAMSNSRGEAGFIIHNIMSKTGALDLQLGVAHAMLQVYRMGLNSWQPADNVQAIRAFMNVNNTGSGVTAQALWFCAQTETSTTVGNHYRLNELAGIKGQVVHNTNDVFDGLMIGMQPRISFLQQGLGADSIMGMQIDTECKNANGVWTSKTITGNAYWIHIGKNESYWNVGGKLFGIFYSGVGINYLGTGRTEVGSLSVGTGASTSVIQAVGLLEYADNAAALAAGLTAGAFYRTGDVLKVVH
jgi:hypothetical protein